MADRPAPTRADSDAVRRRDAEAALLVPWIDQWMDVKVIGGYYSFDNQTFGPQRGGTEIAVMIGARPPPPLVVRAHVKGFYMSRGERSLPHRLPHPSPQCRKFDAGTVVVG